MQKLRQRIVLAVVATCIATVSTAACVSLGGLTADTKDASTASDAADTPDVARDTSSIDDAGNAADAADAADASDAAELPVFHRIFVTSGTTTGNLGGLAGADAKCAAAAKSGGLSGVYKAILSDPSKTARDRLSFHLPIRVVATDGTSELVANDAADLWDGMLSAPINRDEHGAMVPQGAVWTGSSTDGTLPGDAHCLYWGSAVSANSGWAGNSAATNGSWIISVWGPQMYTSLSCDALGRLYCVAQ